MTRYSCGVCGGVVITTDLAAARALHDERARRGLVGCRPGAPWFVDILAGAR